MQYFCEKHCFLRIVLSCQSDLKKKIARIEEKSFGCCINERKKQSSANNGAEEFQQKQHIYIPVKLNSSKRNFWVCVTNDASKCVETSVNKSLFNAISFFKSTGKNFDEFITLVKQIWEREYKFFTIYCCL